MLWPSGAKFLLVVVPVLLVIIVALWSRLLRVQSHSTRRVSSRRNGAIDRSTRRLERDLEGQVEFFQIFSELLGELHAQRQIRQIPPTLVNAMVRMFRPEVAVVLVRRRSTITEPDRENRLIVAAISTAQRQMKVGMEVRFGEGQLGIAAARQRVMVRKDFEEEALPQLQHQPDQRSARVRCRRSDGRRRRHHRCCCHRAARTALFQRTGDDRDDRQVGRADLDQPRGLPQRRDRRRGRWPDRDLQQGGAAGQAQRSRLRRPKQRARRSRSSSSTSITSRTTTTRTDTWWATGCSDCSPNSCATASGRTTTSVVSAARSSFSSCPADRPARPCRPPR